MARSSRNNHRLPDKYHDKVFDFRDEIHRACTFTVCGRTRLPFFSFYVKKQWHPWLAYLELFNNLFVVIITVINLIVDPVAVAVLGFFSILFGQCLIQYWYGYNRYQNPIQTYVAFKRKDVPAYSERLTEKKIKFDERRDLMEVLHCGRLDRSPLYGVQIVGFFVRFINDLILGVIAFIVALVLAFMLLLDKCVIFSHRKVKERSERIARSKTLLDDGETNHSGSDQHAEEDNRSSSTDVADASGVVDDDHRDTSEDDHNDAASQSSTVSVGEGVEVTTSEASEDLVDEEAPNEGTPEATAGSEEDDSESDIEEDNLVGATAGLSIFCLDADQIVEASFKYSGIVASFGGSLMWACLYASYDFTMVNHPEGISGGHEAVLYTMKIFATSMMLFNEEYYTALLYRKNVVAMFCAFLDLDAGDWITEMLDLPEDTFGDFFENLDNPVIGDMDTHEDILRRTDGYLLEAEEDRSASSEEEEEGTAQEEQRDNEDAESA